MHANTHAYTYRERVQLRRFNGSWSRLFKIVGAHPASSGVIEAEVLWALERRVAALERQLREHQEALYATPSLALRELKRQVDSFKNKLENNDQLSWLGE
jgi:hypothetical protein